MAGQDIHLLLGEIKGKLDLVIESQGRTEEKLDGMNKRISQVESNAAKHGLITGAVAAVGIAIIKGKLGLGA